MTINERKQFLTPGKRVELYDFDATAQGSNSYNFVSCFAEEQPLVWRGLTYTPLPIKATGFEINGKGALPTPRLQISNILLLPGSIINDIGDPIGAKITRWVTFSDYLDDGVDPSPDEHFDPQIFFIERKVSQNRIFIEFELSSAMDHQGRKLPKQQIIRDTCPLIYRKFNPQTGDFDYTNATCPYVGEALFKANGDTASSKEQDVCGKRLGECKKRFGSDPLPFGGFPAVARTR